MLVLTRKCNEKILIGKDIVITVVGTGVGTNSVRIGIEAPKDVRVVREELLTRSAK